MGIAGCSEFGSDDDSEEPETGSESESTDNESDDAPGSGSEDEEEEDDEQEDEDNEEDEQDEREEDENEDEQDDEAEDEEFDVEEPEGVLADVPIPDDPESYEYPIAGTGDAPGTIRLFGGWKCRHTRRFLLGFFEEIVDEYVRPGLVDIEFHAVAYRNGGPLHGQDGPRTARAGFAVWQDHPEQFWSYLEYSYTNMERQDGWATDGRLGAIAEEVGLEQDVVTDLEDDAFESHLEETMTYVDQLAVTDVPRFEIDGEVYAPNVEPEETLAALDAVTEDADGDGEQAQEQDQDQDQEQTDGTDDESETDDAVDGDGDDDESEGDEESGSADDDAVESENGDAQEGEQSTDDETDGDESDESEGDEADNESDGDEDTD